MNAIVQDLVIVIADRGAFRDVLDHFDATDEYVEIRLDRRRGERRAQESRAQVRVASGFALEPPASERRHRRDRRRLDVSETLRTAGWVVIPSAHRSAAGR